MKLSYITINVRDLEKSQRFYQELVGLKYMCEINPPMGKIVFLGNNDGETMIELVGFAETEKVEAKAMVLAFEAGMELPVLREKAIELGYEPSEIIEMPPKPTFFTVFDPDGIMVEFS